MKNPHEEINETSWGFSKQKTYYETPSFWERKPFNLTY